MQGAISFNLSLTLQVNAYNIGLTLKALISGIVWYSNIIERGATAGTIFAYVDVENDESMFWANLLCDCHNRKAPYEKEVLNDWPVQELTVLYRVTAQMSKMQKGIYARPEEISPGQYSQLPRLRDGNTI